MAYDFEKILRRTRSARAANRLERRPDEDLVFVEDLPAVGGRLLLDTCVYLDGLQGRTPPAVDALIETRTIHHSAVAVAELAFAFGRLDPGDPRTPAALKSMKRQMTAIPAHRLVEASAEDWSEGAILAGVLARVLGFSQDQRRKALHDAILAVQAIRIGLVLVTRNVSDFDRLSQLDPRLNVAFYRRA